MSLVDSQVCYKSQDFIGQISEMSQRSILTQGLKDDPNH